jgi:hypothetical protein
MFLLFPRGASPNGANFEDHDTVTLNAIAEIDFTSEVRSGSLVFDESSDRAIDPRQFHFAQRHPADA